MHSHMADIQSQCNPDQIWSDLVDAVVDISARIYTFALKDKSGDHL